MNGGEVQEVTIDLFLMEVVDLHSQLLYNSCMGSTASLKRSKL